MALIKLVAILGLVCLTSANFNITSPPITNWGNWGNFDQCPSGRYAQGFQLKTEPNQFFGDDTALNAIRLFCGDPFRPDTAVITGTEGDFGSWGHVYTCYPGVLTGFQLRVESDRGSGDDTATNNVRFTCSDDPNEYIEGDGLFWGEWSDYQNCYGNQAICGIQTQMEPYLGEGDDSMLNNVRLECCDMNRDDLQAGYDYVRENGAYPQKLSPEFAALLRKAVADELDNSANDQERVGKLNFAKLVRRPTINGEEKKVSTIEKVLKGISEALQKKELEEARKERQRIKFVSNLKSTLETYVIPRKSKEEQA